MVIIYVFGDWTLMSRAPNRKLRMFWGHDVTGYAVATWFQAAKAKNQVTAAHRSFEYISKTTNSWWLRTDNIPRLQRVILSSASIWLAFEMRRAARASPKRSLKYLRSSHFGLLSLAHFEADHMTSFPRIRWNHQFKYFRPRPYWRKQIMQARQRIESERFRWTRRLFPKSNRQCNWASRKAASEEAMA